MKDRNLILSAMDAGMEISRTQVSRVLDPEAANVRLNRLSRAAKLAGRD